MSLLKAINRLQRMHHFIKIESTGTSEEFSEKLGISRSMLMENLREMKELGAQIFFCPHRRSYCYLNDFSLLIGEASRNKLKGGAILSWEKTRENFLQSNGIGHSGNSLESPSW